MMTALNIGMDGRSRKTVMIVSVVLLFAGIAAIAAPRFVSMALAFFVGWLFVLAGVVAFFITWHGFRARGIAWLKPFVLTAVGLLIVFYPVAGTAAMGLLLAVYFLIDGFAGVGFALELRPYRGWGWLLFNGIVSFALAAVFLIGWPFTSAWLLGLFVGISLLFDGVALFAIALASERLP